VHRDIKPDNLLIGNDGYLKVCDYGLSKNLGGPEGRTHSMVGTLPYIAPEIINRKTIPNNNNVNNNNNNNSRYNDNNNQGYDFAVDFWSLGITMFELCYGYTPFEPNSMLTDSMWESTIRSNIISAPLYFPSKVKKKKKKKIDKLIF
jgi:serine/threonine protein kinase